MQKQLFLTFLLVANRQPSQGRNDNIELFQLPFLRAQRLELAWGGGGVSLLA
jgi:hypothetical protein